MNNLLKIYNLRNILIVVILFFLIVFIDSNDEFESFCCLFCLVVIYFVDSLFTYLYKKNNIKK